MNLTTSEAKHIRERAKREGLARLPNETTLLSWLKEYRTPSTPAVDPYGKAKSVCPGCQREHYVNPKDYPYGMNPTGVYCPLCVFHLED